MRKRSRQAMQLVALALVCAGGMAFTFGGWAVITVDDLPQSLTVGQPVTLAFSVRQHGMTLLDHLSPAIVVGDGVRGTRDIAVLATPSGPSGHYVASFSVPRAGNWTVTINSGFMNSHVSLLPIPTTATAIATKGANAHAEAPAEFGRRLFVAKGCVTCHVHGALEGYQTVSVGPNLTPKRYQAEYLAKLLADPSIARTAGQTFTMPNLGLKTSEIAALVAFINSDRQLSTRQ